MTAPVVSSRSTSPKVDAPSPLSSRRRQYACEMADRWSDSTVRPRTTMLNFNMDLVVMCIRPLPGLIRPGLVPASCENHHEARITPRQQLSCNLFMRNEAGYHPHLPQRFQ